MLYTVDMKVAFGDGYLTTSKDLEKIMNDFKFYREKYTKHITFYDPDYDVKERVNNSDVIRILAGSLFSKKLVDKLKFHFTNDYEFINVNILNNENINNAFYIFRVRNVIDCIDEENSLYDEDGYLDEVSILKDKIPEGISCFRIKGAEYIIIYTDSFFDLIEKNKFNVDIQPYSP
ncbi:hypothetical protein ACPEEL_03675 [Pasteurella sp. PK-2025]|uniref:hypothetical protein n=1 Tax=unclassified Pasteurella TaxID=2621516 RepID=UPI003C70C9E7